MIPFLVCQVLVVHVLFSFGVHVKFIFLQLYPPIIKQLLVDTDSTFFRVPAWFRYAFPYEA